jgi:hypothetical protein
MLRDGAGDIKTHFLERLITRLLNVVGDFDAQALHMLQEGLEEAIDGSDELLADAVQGSRFDVVEDVAVFCPRSGDGEEEKARGSEAGLVGVEDLYVLA